MTVTVDTTAPSTPPAPRLRLEPTGSTRTLLDGGWWPRTGDPALELPGVILAIDKLHGLVTRVVLSVEGWSPRPHALAVAGRRLRIGYFVSQPAALLTARCTDGGRVDLLVVPPRTPSRTAEAAMVLAATAGNRVHAQDLLAAAAGQPAARTGRVLPEQVPDDRPRQAASRRRDSGKERS